MSIAIEHSAPNGQRIIIIGAGIAGLAMANILAKAGHSVDIYEKNDHPGGRAGQIKIDGFTFDSGPSWYLMPEIFEHYFELLGEDINDYIELVRLAPAYKVFFKDQPSIIIDGEQASDSHTFETIEPGAADALAGYLEGAEQTYQLAKKYFLYNNFDSLNVVKREVLAAGPRMASAAFQSLDGNVSHHVRDERLKQILEYPAVFLGTSPYKAPAIYSLMSHLDFNQGVFYPRGGIYKVIEALVTVGQKLGVRYYYGSAVSHILTEASQAHGVALASGKTASADLVISAADLHFTETKLLPSPLQTYPESYWAKKIAGPSALLLYLGIKGSLPRLKHHNLLFTPNWQTSFSQIFDNKTWPDPASLYVCVPSKTDATVAPAGYENMFVLVPGPAIKTVEPEQLKTLAERYIKQIATMTGIADLADRIVVKKLYGPQDFASDFNAWDGTALGMAHTLRQSAMFRPRNRSRKVRGLYYVGSGTIPGIGLPMCLISAETLYKRLIDDHSAGPLTGTI
jgi:phytoene desaturase